jgi:predicted outer membrane repeat protein
MKRTLIFPQYISVITLCMALSLLLSGQIVRAATFNTPCDAAQLAADITTANTNNQPDTINLAEDCLYTLAATLVIANDGVGNTLTINGNGAIFNGSDSIRVLEVNSGANLMMREVHIEEGFGVCALCLPNAGFVAGIWNDGTLEIVDGSVRDSHAGSNAGGIYSGGSLTLTNVVISGNSASVGGGLYIGGGTVIIHDSIIEANTASGAGGIYNFGGNITIDNSVIALNTAFEGGGFANEMNGIVNITNSIFYGNTAVENETSGGNGGAIVNYATLSLTNSTLSQNSATQFGGAIYSSSSLPENGAVTTFSNVTIANNTAGVNGSGIYNNMNSTFSIANSIIASSGTAANCAAIVPITDNGFNIATDASCSAGFTVTTNNALGLGTLSAGQGLQRTHALLPGSVAIDTGNCVTGNDQRGAGFARPIDLAEVPNAAGGNGCDVGAYELQSLPAVPISPLAATPEPNYFSDETPTLTWSPITWAVTYEIDVADNRTFTGAAHYSVDADELSVVVDTPPLADGKFYWRVRAISPIRVGEWSSTQIFTVEVP